MGGYILAQKLEIERSKSFAGSILLQTRAIRNWFRVLRTGIYPLSSGKFEPKLLKITMHVRRSRLLFKSSSEVGFYFGPEARKYAFKNFSVSVCSEMHTAKLFER